jgi:23S rRNA pseudouridine1911/1915/1917 synthase
MVVYKKEGFLTVGTDKDKINTVYHVLNKYMKSYGRDKRIYVVHRLDRETSGLLIFAKSQEVQETLQKNWTKMVTERSYWAVVTGTMPDKKGVIKSYLTEDKSLIMHASEKDNGGDYAELEYEVLQEKHPYTLLKLSLETGRKNQIRVQLKSVGCPIVGDKKYGSTYKTAGRVCLHAGMLHFVHPVTKKHHQFEAPLPVEFKKLLK